MTPEEIMRQLRSSRGSRVDSKDMSEEDDIKKDKPTDTKVNEKPKSLKELKQSSDVDGIKEKSRTKRKSSRQVVVVESTDASDASKENVDDNTPKDIVEPVEPDTLDDVERHDDVEVKAEAEEIPSGRVVEHPEYVRRSVKGSSDTDEQVGAMLFKDIFVTGDDGGITYNRDHDKSVARNLSKGIIGQVVDDLKRKHVNVQVSMGDNYYTVSPANQVFTSPTSLVRYLLLDKIDSDNLSLQLARQLFLDKHPDGENRDFNHSTVRTDERDIYGLLLSTKADPERNLVEKIDELIRNVNANDEVISRANNQIVKYSQESNNLLNGINMASSLLVLERLGLTEGQIPRDMDHLRGFITQDNVVKFSDKLSGDVAMDAIKRKDVMERHRRVQNSRSARTSRRNLRK